MTKFRELLKLAEETLKENKMMYSFYQEKQKRFDLESLIASMIATLFFAILFWIFG